MKIINYKGIENAIEQFYKFKEFYITSNIQKGELNMISKRLEEAINVQINKELFSEYLYLSMAAYLSSVGLEGFENFLPGCGVHAA